MEQKLQIQWQNSAPDHGKCRKTQTAFEQLHQEMTSAVSLRACPITGTPPVSSWPNPCRTVQLNCYRFCSPNSTEKSAQPQTSPCAAKRPWHGTLPKPLLGADAARHAHLDLHSGLTTSTVPLCQSTVRSADRLPLCWHSPSTGSEHTAVHRKKTQKVVFPPSIRSQISCARLIRSPPQKSAAAHSRSQLQQGAVGCSSHQK